MHRKERNRTTVLKSDKIENERGDSSKKGSVPSDDDTERALPFCSRCFLPACFSDLLFTPQEKQDEEQCPEGDKACRVYEWNKNIVVIADNDRACHKDEHRWYQKQDDRYVYRQLLNLSAQVHKEKKYTYPAGYVYKIPNVPQSHWVVECSVLFDLYLLGNLQTSPEQNDHGCIRKQRLCDTIILHIVPSLCRMLMPSRYMPVQYMMNHDSMSPWRHTVF